MKFENCLVVHKAAVATAALFVKSDIFMSAGLNQFNLLPINMFPTLATWCYISYNEQQHLY